MLDGVVAADPSTMVWTSGDNAYENASDSDYATKYAPTWGRHRSRTRPVPGNHEYQTPNAAGYFNYFCPTATNCVFPGGTQQKYYSYNLGNWHIVSLNSEIEITAGSRRCSGSSTTSPPIRAGASPRCSTSPTTTPERATAASSR